MKKGQIIQSLKKLIKNLQKNRILNETEKKKTEYPIFPPKKWLKNHKNQNPRKKNPKIEWNLCKSEITKILIPKFKSRINT